jgi:hypothetical protein
MRYSVGAALIVSCLLLITSTARVALLPIGQAFAADVRLASLHEDAAAPQANRTEKRSMTPWPRMAQVRCPMGQLVFLTTECGCKGACCNCSANARYLNHCTCQCSTNPPSAGACIKGFSVGRN